MEIWPAIDIRGGQCVRLKQGDYQQETVYGESPVKMAQYWFESGAKRLHLVDLDGAKSGKSVNFDAIQKIVETVSIPCELGGGIRDAQTIQRLLDVGVARLVIGTLALKEPKWFRQMAIQFPYRLVLGIDARNGMVATDGWLETSQTSAIDLARQFEDLPLAALVYTDIATDGMMKGPNFAEMKTMNQAVSIPLVASGGVTSIDDVARLNNDGIPACIIGRALYEETIQLAEALKFEFPVEK
ncbi:MAG: 1-(5-phosphoribosyl)-5-[(5-phosphoribosylamino)methylideneamino]imidazole-4-carboxamide isomerase [Planctomycetia bacterium]|nr:1-(5-phosphoribosyl)-5-[(5-phosphoribosylamino)methylideneamino]imidazole-4-carboxamide isomerase [Planctomycetia bacterium]